MRMYIMFGRDVFNPTMIFFTVKNTIVLLLDTYRLAVVKKFFNYEHFNFFIFFYFHKKIFFKVIATSIEKPTVQLKATNAVKNKSPPRIEENDEKEKLECEISEKEQRISDLETEVQNLNEKIEQLENLVEDNEEEIKNEKVSVSKTDEGAQSPDA